MWSEAAKQLFNQIEPVAEQMGLKIVEIDMPTGQNGIFRLYVDSLDKEKKVSVDDCSKLSPVISAFLDTTEQFNFRYYLEVSSPGLDRPIRRWEEMVDFIGKKIKVALRERINDRKRYTGKLVSVNEAEDFFTVLEEDGKEYQIRRDVVRKINIIWEGDK